MSDDSYDDDDEVSNTIEEPRDFLYDYVVWLRRKDTCVGVTIWNWLVIKTYLPWMYVGHSLLGVSPRAVPDAKRHSRRISSFCEDKVLC